MAELKVEKREKTGKYVNFNMRKEGKIPGVMYGKGLENENLSVPLKDLMHLVDAGERLMDVDVDGSKQKVVIKDLQYGTFDWEINHVDFIKVTDDSILHLDVELELTGEAVGQKEGALLEMLVHSVHIECTPKTLPEKILVDVSAMKIGDILHVSELPALEGAKYNMPGDIAIISCQMPRGEEVEAVAEIDEGEEPAVPEETATKTEE